MQESHNYLEGDYHIKAGIWHFCSHLLISISKILTWVIIFPHVGTVSQKQKQKDQPP